MDTSSLYKKNLPFHKKDEDGWESMSSNGEDSEGRKLLRFKKNLGVVAPKPITPAKKFGLKKEVTESPPSLRLRKQLAPWEQIRKRQITLPDSKTPHRMMFLNYQPGETSDFIEQDQNTNMPSYTSALPSDEAIVKNSSFYNTTAAEEKNSPKSSVLPSEDYFKKRMVNSELPPVPLGEEKNTDLLEMDKDFIKEDDADSLIDSISIMGDHVYDVPSELSLELDKHSQTTKNSAPTLSSLSDYTSSDIESSMYHASGSDNCTESYVYSGSLISQDSDDTTSTIYYPSGSKNQSTFKKSRSSPLLTQKSNPFNRYLNKREKFISHSDSDTTGESSSVSGSFAVKNRPPRKTKTRVSQHKKIKTYLDLASPNPSGLNLEESVKLKLWDLRLVMLNREQNHYSTFPFRKPALDDYMIGQFSRCPEFGYRHRHNSDISSDNYVMHKIQRILRAPVITKYLNSSGSESWNQSHNIDENVYKNDSLRSDLTRVDSLKDWKQFFNKIGQSECNSMKNFYPELSSLRPLSEWPKFEDEDSIYEPMTLSGIFNLEKKNAEDGTDESEQSDADDSRLCRYLGMEQEVTSSGSGSVYSGNIQASSASVPSDASDVNDGHHSGDDEADRRRLVFNHGAIINWRRQAELFKDKNFITLIL